MHTYVRKGTIPRALPKPQMGLPAHAQPAGKSSQVKASRAIYCVHIYTVFTIITHNQTNIILITNPLLSSFIHTYILTYIQRTFP